VGQPLNLRVFDTIDQLNRELAESIAGLINQSLGVKDHFNLVLAGGNTPRALYRYLAENYRNKIPWSQIRFFWSDERYVPVDDPQSNYGMAKEALLDHVPVNPSIIFPMPTDYADPADAAKAYEKVLKSQFDSERPQFNLSLLGLGEDCHVASLFPHAAILSEMTRWVASSISPKEPTRRISLTLPVINSSKNIYFLVTGENKAEPLKRVLSKDSVKIEDCPARGVHPVINEPIWWANKEAARLVENR
jgi:6-phosphogluconolactonase